MENVSSVKKEIYESDELQLKVYESSNKIIEKNLIVFSEKSNGYYFFKRLIDILGSLCGLVVLSPLLVVVYCVIKIKEPKEKVFFSQVRVGKDEQLFNMYKFRSMYSNAEERLEELLLLNEVEGAMFKMKEDPRITPIGKIIRKYSIDELPQLLNVLIGNMSLVGPRPPLLREVKDYSKYDKQRLLIKPGCTGLWQVSGRSEIGFEEMVELDIEYIENRSLLLDIKIMLKTVAVIIFPKGAY